MKATVKLCGGWSVAAIFMAGYLAFGAVLLNAQTPCTPTPSGAAAWWPGEGNGNDIVGGNTAILESGVTFAPGEVGQAFELNNYTNGFMHVPASPSLDVGAGSGLTMEGWINVSSVSGFHPIAEWYSNTRGNVGVQLWLNSNPSESGALFAALPDTNGVQHTLESPADTLVPNTFQHVALTYDKTSGIATLYVNGAVVAQSNLGSFEPQTTYDLWIGHRPFDVPGDWTYGAYLGGLLDELTLYRRALTSDEIAAIYNAGAAGKCAPTNNSTSCTPTPSGVAAWWPAEGNGNDIVGGNTAILQGDATFAPGEVGQAFQLNDTNAYLRVPASSNLNVAAGGSLTIEAWVKVSDVTGYHPIAEWNNNAGLGGAHLWILPYDGDTGVLFANVVGTDGNSHPIRSPAGSVTSNVFQHVAVTYDQTSGMGTLYVNGNMVAQSDFGQFTPQTTYDFWMGHRPNDSPQNATYGAYLGGLLDELSLYRRALSPAEIAAIYNAGTAGKCGSTISGTAPVITTQPTNQTVATGGTASFSVVASGTQPLGYRWFGPGSNVIAGANSSTLTLSNVQPSNAGAYFVLVTNGYGFAKSSNATLTLALPPVSTITVVHADASGGSSVDVPINLVATGNENALSFSLSFDPTRLNYSNITLGSGGGDALFLPNVSLAANGQIGVQLALPSGETFPAGTQEILRVTFTTPILTGTQALVTTLDFSNQPIAKLVSDTFGEPLANSFIGGTVTLSPSPLEGDAAPVPSGNGNLDLFDWVQVGRYVAGLDPITNRDVFQKVDCAPRNTQGDGKLKVTDWVQAGRYASGLDPLTIAGGPTGPAAPMIQAQPNIPNARQLTVNSGSVVKGLTMTLPINLQAQGDETALAFSLNFDPAVLRYVKTVKGSAAASAVLEVNSNQAPAGQLALVLCLPAGGSHFAAGTMEIARVTFLAVASGTNSTVGFADQPVLRSISDANAVELAANYVGNSVAINPPPVVSMPVVGNKSLLSWPAWAGDFTLQAAGNLTPPIAWTNVPVTLQTNGDRIEITVPTPNQPVFFRLYHP
jgi:hypothetical protein